MAKESNLMNTSNLLNQNEINNFFVKSLTCGNDDKEKILNFIKNLFDNNLNQNTQDELNNYITWAEKKGNLKVTNAPVPKDIIKDDAFVHDVRIECRGPDDKIFDKEASIRAKVARGNCILELNGPNRKREYDLIVFALRKFTGGLGDEDDVDRNKNDWRKYFLADISRSKYIISTKKANGEAAHLSCRWHNDSFLICTGSKNVHLVFRKRSDLLLNYGDSRYQVAKIVSLAICKFLEDLDEDLRNMFLSFLSLTRLTIVLEILIPDSQHVEDLSYLNEPLLKFITFTQTKIVEQPTSLCYMPPHYCIEVAKLFKLSCVDVLVLPFEKVEDHIRDVRKDHGYEGVVLYFMDEHMNIIGILKKKTTWYILLRAIREKFRSYLSPKFNVTPSELEKKIAKRLEEIKSWIGFDEDYFNNWKTLAIKFTKWFTNAINSKKIERDMFYNRYPVIWTRFLHENNLTDKFEMCPHEDDQIVQENKTINNFNKLCIPDNYIPDEEDGEIDDNDNDNRTNCDKKLEIENKIENEKVNNIEQETMANKIVNDELFKQIQDQLLNPKERLSKKDKRKLKKKLKKQLKKCENNIDKSDDDSEENDDILSSLNIN